MLHLLSRCEFDDTASIIPSGTAFVNVAAPPELFLAMSHYGVAHAWLLAALSGSVPESNVPFPLQSFQALIT